MLFYISLYLICLFLSILAVKTNNKYVIYIISAVLVFIAGCRGSQVGIDTENYIKIWNDVLYGRPTFIEPGFTFMIFVLQKITNNPVAMFITSSIIIYQLIILRLWDYRKLAYFPMMVTVLYMSHFMISMNILRQYCAVAIVFYFIKYLFRGKYLLYICGVLLASTFHLSSLIGFSLFALEIFRWNDLTKCHKMILGFGIIISPLVFVVALNFAINEFGNYFATVKSNFGFMTLAKLMFILIATFSSKLPNKSNGFLINTLSSNYVIKSTISLTVIGFFLISIGYFFAFMDRIGLLFSFYEIIFWGFLFKLTIWRNRILYFVAFLILIVFPFLSTILNNGQGTVPYVFCW